LPLSTYTASCSLRPPRRPDTQAYSSADEVVYAGQHHKTSITGSTHGSLEQGYTMAALSHRPTPSATCPSSGEMPGFRRRTLRNLGWGVVASLALLTAGC